MTTVIFYRKKDGMIHGFSAKGHAGFGVRGTDVVCASVSVLLINAVNSISRLTADQSDAKINERKATIDLWIETPGESATLLLQSLELGLNGIASEYPGNVTIKFEEV